MFRLLTLIAVAVAVMAAGASALPSADVVLVNKTFKCSNYPQPIDFDLVKVTVTGSERHDGILTGSSCTGRIGFVDIVTSTDGIKIQAGTHDLVIEGGEIDCTNPLGDVHQDGVQAMGGARVTLRNLDIDCGTNSAIFFNKGSGGTQRPTDIVCDGCTLRKWNELNRTVRIVDSLRSGVRNSTVYYCGPSCGNQAAVAIQPEASSPVNQNNTPVLYGG